MSRSQLLLKRSTNLCRRTLTELYAHSGSRRRPIDPPSTPKWLAKNGSSFLVGALLATERKCASVMTAGTHGTSFTAANCSWPRRGGRRPSTRQRVLMVAKICRRLHLFTAHNHIVTGSEQQQGSRRVFEASGLIGSCAAVADTPPRKAPNRSSVELADCGGNACSLRPRLNATKKR